MTANSDAGMVQEVLDNLGAFFRHLFPGILIMGAAYVAHPSWFSGMDTHSWEHLTIAAVIAVTAGNIWFAFNRHVLQQLVDWILYLFRCEGPAPTASRFKYRSDLGKYVAKSLCATTIPLYARQHVAFRASSILLLYTVAGVGLLFSWWNETNTLFARHPCWITICSVVLFVAGVWQQLITRAIDDLVVHYEPPKPTQGHKSSAFTQQ